MDTLLQKPGIFLWVQFQKNQPISPFACAAHARQRFPFSKIHRELQRTMAKKKIKNSKKLLRSQKWGNVFFILFCSFFFFFIFSFKKIPPTPLLPGAGSINVLKLLCADFRVMVKIFWGPTTFQSTILEWDPPITIWHHMICVQFLSSKNTPPYSSHALTLPLGEVLVCVRRPHLSSLTETASTSWFFSCTV